jgi:hypothetical protein
MRPRNGSNAARLPFLDEPSNNRLHQIESEPAVIATLLRSTAKDLGQPGRDPLFGDGLIDYLQGGSEGIRPPGSISITQPGVQPFLLLVRHPDPRSSLCTLRAPRASSAAS